MSTNERRPSIVSVLLTWVVLGLFVVALVLGTFTALGLNPGSRLAAVMAALGVPVTTINGQQVQPTAVVSRPALSPAQRQQYSENAPGSGMAVEDHAAQPALSITPPPYQPPVSGPVSAPLSAPQGVTIDMLCPDGTYQAHCPDTRPGVLTAEQKQAVEETDSVLNSLNSAESTMTEAQKMAAAHDAEWAIKDMNATATAQAAQQP